MTTARPLYLLPPPMLADTWVSEQSRWSDARWQFRNPTAGSRPTASSIRWDITMPDGSCFSDPQWAALQDAFKRLVWSWKMDPQDGRVWKPGSLPLVAKACHYFIRWMATRGYGSFAELDRHACEAFLDDLSADKAGGPDGDDGPSASGLLPYITIPLKIHTQRLLLHEAGVPMMPERPFGGQSAFVVAKQLSRIVTGQIPPVPDAVFLPVTATVITWLGSPAHDILRVHQGYWEIRHQYATHPSSTRAVAIRHVLRRFRFSPLPGRAVPWRDAIQPTMSPTYRQHTRGAERRKLGDVQQLRNLIHDLRDCCVIAIQAFVGMRISEVCGLQAAPRHPTTGLPACVDIRSSLSGLHDVFYITGQLYKTTAQWEPATWVAGSRPKDSDYLPPPIAALTILEELYRPWRELMGSNDLIVGFRWPTGLPTRAADLRPMTSVALAQGQRAWITQYVEMPASAKTWHVTTHQWRKSFALYMVRTDSRLLQAVRQHFKHVSLAMTEQGYLGNDADLLGIMDDTLLQETARILFEITTGQTRVGGKLATVIAERRAQIQQHLDGLDTQAQRREIEHLVRSTDMRVYACDWGWCLFRPETARCTTHVGRFKMQARRPDLAQRYPAVCCECANLAVTPDHAAFWRDRLATYETAIRQYHEMGHVGVAAVYRERADQSRAILKMMGAWEEQRQR